MVKRILKRILVFSSVACLVLACLSSFSFAIDPVSGAAALAGAIDAYGMAYGVGTVYDVSSSSGVSSSFEGLWDEFSAYQSNAGSQFDYDSFIDDYNQNRSLYGFDHSSGKFAAWSIDSESAEIFDQFWNWLLTGPAEMSRVDNDYFQFSSSQIGSEASPISVASSSSYTFAGQPVALWSECGYPSNFTGFRVTSSSQPVLSYIAHINGSYYPTYVSLAPFSVYYYNPNNGSAYNRDATKSGNGLEYYLQFGFGWGSVTWSNPAPVYNYYLHASSSSDVAVSSESVGVKSYSEDGVADLPNPYGQDYVPVPLEIVTNIPWDSSYDDTDEENGDPVPFPPFDVPLVMDDILTAISAEDYSIEEDPQDPDPDPPPPAPSEFFVPLLPVGLPSFDFSFSGIWHYVREWVSSLGAWFTTLFTIWSALPYAMVVPVYATAVVVIVLGVYKRFFM